MPVTQPRCASIVCFIAGGVALAPIPTSLGSLGAQTPVSIRAAEGGCVEADSYGAGERGVVLAHGGRFDRSGWREQARELAAAGYRVVAIDFRAAVAARTGHETPCLYDATCLCR